MSLSRYFSEDEFEKIEQAVAKAEKETSGEIVPAFVMQSDMYVATSYKVGAITLLALFLGLIVLDRTSLSFHVYDPVWSFLITIPSATVMAFLVAKSRYLKRTFTRKKILIRAVFAKADQLFLEHEVFQTEKRTGVLIFISFLEHKVVVKVDKGISELVSQSEWDSIVTMILSGIKKKQIAEGIVQAIEECGTILKKHSPSPEGHKDPNELSDKLVID